KVFALGTSALRETLDTLAENIATDEVDGLPYIIFNSLGWKRGENITITGDAHLARMAVFDRQGNRLACDLEQKEDKYTLLVHVPSIPAFGYTTIWLREASDVILPVREEKSFPST
ncbi:alpha-mannosidase, partial [Clostridioides difficile]